MRLTSRQHALVEELELFHDAQERLAHIVDRARRRPALPAAQRIPNHLVPGCSSSVWLVSELRDDGRCYFHADADSPVVRGLVQVLIDFFSGALPAEIVASDADPLTILDLLRTLSPTRQRGLAAVRATIKTFAQSKLPADGANQRG